MPPKRKANLSRNVSEKVRKANTDKIAVTDATVKALPSSDDFDSDNKENRSSKKVISWNINGLRAWLKKGGKAFLDEEDPDVICLQETKLSRTVLPDDAIFPSYHPYYHHSLKPGYAGVALYSKEKPLRVWYGVGDGEHDDEGRIITAEYDKYFVVGVYVPNSGRGLPRLQYRTEEWDPDLREYLKKLEEDKPLILCGDLNVAHKEIDLFHPKTNTKNAGFTPQEREQFSILLEKNDYIDTFRHLYPDKTGAYTFWSAMRSSRSKNVGWRLDYFLLSKGLQTCKFDSIIHSDVLGSDHAPIALHIDV